MQRKDEAQLALAQAKRALRSIVHLKHALAAMEELNELEPALEQRYYDAVNASQPFSLDVKALVDSVDARS